MANAAAVEDFPIPIALCLERIGASEDERYVRCTARSGRLAGLGIGHSGAILWCRPEPVACELWVSRDQRLMALRPLGAPRMRLVRAGRAIQIPEDKPVVLRHQDELILEDLEGVRFCVHVHGTTQEVHAPRPVLSLRAATLAAAMALGSASCGGQVSPLVEQSDQGSDAATEFTLPPEDTGCVDDPIIIDTGTWAKGRPIPPAGDGGTRLQAAPAFDAGLPAVDQPDAIEIRNFPPK